MREPERNETIRKAKLSNATLTVNVEEEPDDLIEAIRDALPGADLGEFNIEEVYRTKPYGHERGSGESPTPSKCPECGFIREVIGESGESEASGNGSPDR